MKRANKFWALLVALLLLCNGIVPVAWADKIQVGQSSSTISFGRGYATSPGASTLVPIGSQFIVLGDGINSDQASQGPRNWVYKFIQCMGGRLMPSPNYMSAKSGGDTTTIHDRINYAIAAQADVAIFGSQGHNPNQTATPGTESDNPRAVLANDPDLNATTALAMAAWKLNLDDWIAGNPNAKLIPVLGTVPSAADTTETDPSSFNPAITIRQRVWDLQEAYVLSKNDPRIFYMRPSGFNPSTMTPVGDYVHPNELGADYIAYTLVCPTISAKVVAADRATIASMITGGTYPGLTGASNGDSTYALSGTGGTKTGTIQINSTPTSGDTLVINGTTITFGTTVAISGTTTTASNLRSYLETNKATLGLSTTSVSGANVTITQTTGGAFTWSTSGTTPPTVLPIANGELATGKSLNNTLAGVSLNLTRDTSLGYTVQKIELQGTLAAQTALTLASTSSASTNSTLTPGQYGLYGFDLKIDNGSGGAPYKLFSWSATWGNNGTWGNSSNVSGVSATALALDGYVLIPPKTYSTSNPAGSPTLVLRFDPGTWDSTNKAIISFAHPTLYRIDTRTKSAPYYYGSDTITGANQLMRLTPTSSAITSRVNVRVVATGNVNIASAPSSIDGVTLSNGDRVGLPVQTSTAQNGIYQFNGAGSALTRTSDYDTQTEMQTTSYAATEGSTLINSVWAATSVGTPFTLDTTAVTTARYNLRTEPGSWLPYGLTEADFATRKIYKGGDATVGSGTLVATLSGSTWTWNVDASLVADNDNLWLEVAANNGVGSTHTARSATAFVVH